MGLSREELGFNIGERTVTISKIENGDLRPSDEIVGKLEKKLGIILIEKVEKTQETGNEFNNDFLETYKKHGMIPTGINPESGLVEIMEQPDHPWFVGTQFHPEYRSTVLNPHPLFISFIKAAIENRK